jgi:hypothetical protein
MKGDPLSLTVESGVSSLSDSEMSDVGSGIVSDGVGRFAAELLSPGELDVIMERVRDQNLRLVGEGGVLSLLSKKILERALEEERTEHLGYERGDAAGRGSGNSRNGTTPKRVLTDAGPVDLDIPRDRAGSFEPKIVPTGATRLEGFSDTIVAWYATGMSTRDIRRQIKRMYGADISAELVSRVTDGVIDELKDWQSRPLDRVYPIMYIDALVVKVRTNGTVVNRPAYLGIGVDREGRKHILGVWLGDGGEGPKFWVTVLSDIKARGVTRCDLRVLRRAQGPTRRYRSDLADSDHPNLRRSSGQGHSALLLVEGPQDCCSRSTGSVHRSQRRSRSRRVRQLRARIRGTLPRHRKSVARSVGTVHPVPRLPADHKKNHLYDEHDRINQLSDA